MATPQRIEPRPGQESVWDYPRPPRIEPVGLSLRIEHTGRLIARTNRSWRVLETSHPPVYYLALAAVTAGTLQPNERTSFCEFKGIARYWDIVDGGQIIVPDAGWS